MRRDQSIFKLYIRPARNMLLNPIKDRKMHKQLGITHGKVLLRMFQSVVVMTS